MFSEYFYHQQEYGKPLFDNWNLLTKNDFEQWISKYHSSFKRPQIQSSSSPSKTEITSSIIEQQASLKHVLEILDHDRDSPLTLCLQAEGVEHIDKFASLPYSFIEAMTYPETTRDAVGNMIIIQIDVPHCYKSHVKIFQGYVSHRNEIGKPIDNDWLSIT